jgi:DNA polymerase IV
MLIELVGIRFTDLVTGTYQIDLYEYTQAKINYYNAIGSIKHRFGEQYLILARGTK